MAGGIAASGHRAALSHAGEDAAPLNYANEFSVAVRLLNPLP